MRNVLLALLFVTVTLAGCSGDVADNSEACEIHEHDGVVESHGDCPDEQVQETGNMTDLPPTAALSADVLNGTAPLLVNFTLEGVDPEGLNLSWELILNGTAIAQGEALPAAANYTFDAGNHTVILSVTDGNHTVATNLTIAALGQVSVEQPELPAGPEPLFRVFDLFEGCELCVDGAPVFNGADGCIGWRLQMNEEDCAWMAFGAEYEGTPFSVFSFTDGNLPLLGNDGNPDIEFRDGCGTSSKQISTQWGGGDKEIGIIPEGARCIVAYEFHWPNLGHTIEISIGADVHS